MYLKFYIMSLVYKMRPEKFFGESLDTNNISDNFWS